MCRIKSVNAIEILDSRGNPTLEVAVTTDTHITASACVPSGASTGENEALELRDNDRDRFLGKGVTIACENVNGPIQELLIGQHVIDQQALDLIMIKADGTPTKSKFGANAILGTSMAIARAAAQAIHLPLYRYLGGTNTFLLPCPMMNIINGGAHADNSLEFQEFMIYPNGAPGFNEALRWGVEIFHHLKKILKEANYSTNVGDEGGFAPNLSSDEEAIELIVKAIETAGYKPKEQVSIALDCAASEFYDKKGKVYIDKKKKLKNEAFKTQTKEEMSDYLGSLVEKYPIISIEDGLDENDWEGWQYLTNLLKDKIQIVGDDIFVTNKNFLNKGLDMGVANSILIKLNQIGTVTETLETIRLAQTHAYSTVISHRSGETEDTFIADLAVAVNAGQIKTGSASRTDRIAKYNRLLKISKELKNCAVFKQSL